MFGLDEVVDGVFGRSPLGLGVIAVAAAVAVAGPRAKPLAKNVIKGYLATTDRAREWVAEATEQIQDLYAEARHEYESELSGAAAAATAGVATTAAATAGATTDATPAAAKTAAPTTAAPAEQLTPAPSAAPATPAAAAEPRPRRRAGTSGSSGIVLPSGEPA